MYFADWRAIRQEHDQQNIILLCFVRTAEYAFTTFLSVVASTLCVSDTQAAVSVTY